MLRSIMDKQWCTEWVVLEKDQSPVYVVTFVCVHGYQWKDCPHLDSSDTYFLHACILIFSIVHRFLEVQHLVSEQCRVKTFLLCFFITEPSWVTLGSRSHVNYTRMVSPGVHPKLGTPFLDTYILFRTGRKGGFIDKYKQKLLIFEDLFYSHNFEKVIFWLNLLEFSRNRNMSSGNTETFILFLCHFCTLFFSWMVICEYF